MAVIPSRLAGVPEAFAHWMGRRQQNAGEQRAVERHEAWRQNLAAVRAQAAQEAQMQRGSMQRFQGDIENQMRILGGEIGTTMLPQRVTNPKYANEMQTWDLEMEEGEDPPVSPMPREIINQDRAMTGQDRYNAEQLYNRAHGTNMPSSSALARMLGAGDAPEPWAETQFNALSGAGGSGFPQDQRKAYAAQGNQSIASAMDRAMKPQYGENAKMAGIMAGGQESVLEQYQDSMLQDVWAVATKLAHGSDLIDANTAFHQIMQAMASGKISPVQIKQTANIDDGSWGGMGADRQELALSDYPENRQQRLDRLAKEFGYGADRTSAAGVQPIIRSQ